MGLKMNIAKTNVTVVDNTPINGKEPGRRIMAGWAAYAKHNFNIMTCTYVVVRYFSCQYFSLPGTAKMP